MSKSNLSKLALMGLASGIILSGNTEAAQLSNHSTDLDNLLAVINFHSHGKSRSNSYPEFIVERELPVEHVYVPQDPSVTSRPAAHDVNKTKPAPKPEQAKPEEPKTEPAKKQPEFSSSSRHTVRITAEKVIPIKQPVQKPAEGQTSPPPPESVPKTKVPQDSLSFLEENSQKVFMNAYGSPSIVAENDVNPASALKTQEDNYSDPNDGNMGYHLLSDEELTLELTEQGMAMYNKLTPEQKELARSVASQRCNGTNECKGLNACRTEKNECAGKGGCKGQGKCALSDKNVAVKLVYDKIMAEKRDKLK